jgi:cation diffusion facilitator family transporter
MKKAKWLCCPYCPIPPGSFKNYGGYHDRICKYFIGSNSFGLDLLAAVIAFVSVQISRRPPDRYHRYGHGKFENLSGTIEALLIFVAAIWIIYEAYEKIINKGTVETVGIGVAIMAVSVVLNIIISSLLMKTARKTHSVALEADAMHLRTDVYTSVGVLAGLAVMQFTGIHLLDPIIAMGVALLIIKAAYDLTVKAFRPLLDVSLSPEEEASIYWILKKEMPAGVLGYHNMRTRRSGPDCMIDMHLVVDKSMTVAEAHDVAHQTEDLIRQQLFNCDILIHTEPCVEGKCFGCVECRVKNHYDQNSGGDKCWQVSRRSW